DGDQVDVLDVVADRVDGDHLGQRELLALGQIQGEHGVDTVVTDDRRELQVREGQMLRLGVTAVEHGRDAAGAAVAARGALTEVGAHFGLDADFTHGSAPRVLAVVGPSTTSAPCEPSTRTSGHTEPQVASITARPDQPVAPSP